MADPKLLALLCCFIGANAAAQQMLTGPALLRKPLVFVPPVTPGVALAQRGTLHYRVTVAIDVDGTVQAVESVDPDDAEFRQALNEVTKFWLFFPEIKTDLCSAIPGTARIDVEYASGGDEGARVWLEYSPGLAVFFAPLPKIVRNAAVPSYPIEELRAGRRGDFYAISPIGPDGRVTEPWVPLANAHGSGLVQAAIRHAKAVQYDPSDRPLRCAITRYTFKIR
jgi:hypothetical protein